MKAGWSHLAGSCIQNNQTGVCYEILAYIRLVKEQVRILPDRSGYQPIGRPNMTKMYLSQAQFEHLFTANYSSLCQLSFSIVKNMDSAKDIVQDFFIKYWEKNNHQTIEVNFEAYAYVSVRNRSLNHIKSLTVKQRHEHLAGPALHEEEETPGTTEETATDNYRVQLIKAINQLPEQRRKVFMMSAVEGFKYSEIAERMNISINTVKTQIRKAYLSIRKNCDIITIAIFIGCYAIHGQSLLFLCWLSLK